MRRLFAVLVCVLASPPAFAASTFHTRYSAPEGCPSRDEFVAAIEQRLPGWTHVDSGAEREVSLEIRSTDAGFTGSVSVDATARPREVAGPRCDSVMRALALVAAVSLDPNAALATEPTTAPAPPVPEPVTPTPPTPPLASSTAPTPPREASATPSFGFGAGGALLFGPAPSALYGVEAHLELGTPSRDLLVRLSGARSFTGTVAVGSGEARFDLIQGEIAGCYLPVRSSVSLATCLITDLGSIQAEGEPSDSLAETKTSTRLWAASGARLGFDFRIVGPLRVQSSMGVLIPWRTQTYVFDNPQDLENPEVLYEASPIALDLRLGLALIFPGGDQE